jgi:hypothetical protein
MDQVKQEPLHHLPPYLDATDEEHEDSHDEDHDSSKRPRLRLGEPAKPRLVRFGHDRS